MTSITPGPNNLMLLASGVNFGVRRTVPHMLGIGIGFTVMVGLIGLGLGQALRASPALGTALKVASAAYVLWLAWKLATAAPLGKARHAGRPLTFLEAAAFQWVNPKAWAMALAATAAYLPPGAPVAGALGVAAVFGLVNVPSVSVWTVFGAGLRRLLDAPAKVRAFNWTMATLLVASFVPLLRD